MKGTEEQESKDRESRRRAKILMKSSGMRFVEWSPSGTTRFKFSVIHRIPANPTLVETSRSYLNALLKMYLLMNLSSVPSSYNNLGR